MTYQARSCPSCGSKGRTDEAFSSPCAETLPPTALGDHWRGLFKEKLFFSYQRCTGCGLLYAPSYFSGEQLGELYASMAPNMDMVGDDALAATQAGYWQAAKAAGARGGGYLEIGPDIGYIVDRAAREGEFDHFWLFEPNAAVHDALATATQGRPHTISTAMDDLSAVPDGSVGLAVMVHVLDHLLDPLAMLERIRAKLRDDGLLLIVTHNERSLLRTIMGRRWPPFCLQHPELYNPQSIDGLVRRGGFARTEVRRSANVFPLPFLARQAAFAAGIKLPPLPLPALPVRLKLGNMLTLARP
jgi:hypothetical protein